RRNADPGPARGAGGRGAATGVGRSGRRQPDQRQHRDRPRARGAARRRRGDRPGHRRLPHGERTVRLRRPAARRERDRGRDTGEHPGPGHRVSAWITPALAAVFWVGLLVQPRVGELVDPWVLLATGGGLLGAALALASLERAGFVATAAGDPRAAVAPEPIRRDRAVWAPLPLALVGTLLLAI